MEEIIAFCGIKCHECGAFLATRDNDDEKRAEVARLWSKKYRASIDPESIRCYGCLSKTGPVFNYCEICVIRKCGIEKGVANCAACGDYACERLERFFQIVPDNRDRLDDLRNRSHSERAS